MAQLSPKEIELLKKSMAAFIDGYIEKNPDSITEIAKGTKYRSIEIITAINDPAAANFQTIADLYYSTKRVIESHKQDEHNKGTSVEENVTTTTENSRDESKNELMDKIDYVKRYIQFNPTEVFEISEKSGLSPQEVVTIINKDDVTLQEIDRVYDTVKSTRKTAKATVKVSQMK